MYKLFLCLRYLRSRVIAYFAMAGVALSVALLVVTSSVMTGFLDKIEKAAKGLFGDIVVDTSSQDGIRGYDELIAVVRKDVPEVQAGTPFIFTGGWLQIPYQRHIRQLIQIAGIRLPQRAEVTDFAKGLWVQHDFPRPTFDPNVDLMLRKVAQEQEKAQAIERREEERKVNGGKLPLDAREMIDRLDSACIYLREGAANLRDAAENRGKLDELEKAVEKANKEGEISLLKALTAEEQHLQARTYEPPENHAILGLGIPGLSLRTDEGETVRVVGPGSKVVLNVIPLGRTFSATDITANQRRFSVVDDCRTDVWSIDSDIVYVPFDTLQVLNNMDQRDANDLPPRCSQVHFKVAQSVARESQLGAVAKKVRDAWLRWRDEDGNAPAELSVQTWRQRQESIIAPIESQRILVTAMFGISAIVCVVLIFVIFYMIVLQKTREIGVMKAVGASGWGVASIFLSYGAVVGLIGAGVGTVIGYYFVHNINPIHDWLGRALGFQIWSRKQYLFEKIPNEVDWNGAAMIAAGAILAGLIGALIPAIRAARMQPVEALRYE